MERNRPLYVQCKTVKYSCICQPKSKYQVCNLCPSGPPGEPGPVNAATILATRFLGSGQNIILGLGSTIPITPGINYNNDPAQ